MTEYQAVREKRSKASTADVTDEIEQANATAESQQEMAADDSGKAYQVSGTGMLKKDEQEHAHKVGKDESAKTFDKAESFSDFLLGWHKKKTIVRPNPLLNEQKEHVTHAPSALYTILSGADQMLLS